MTDSSPSPQPPPARVLLTSIDAAKVRARLEALRELLAAAAVRGGRDAPPEVLVASKYFEAAAIPDLIRAGATLLGENRAELIEPKQATAREAGAPASQWDFIGELQSRKAVGLASQVSRIHTLASASAIRKLAAYAAEGGTMPELLIQVNVAGEVAKGGVAPAGPAQ